MKFRKELKYLSGNRRLNVPLVNGLYDISESVSFINIDEPLISDIFRLIGDLRNEVKMSYPDEEILLYEVDNFTKILSGILGTLEYFDEYMNRNDQAIVKFFSWVKFRYKEIFLTKVTPIVQGLKKIRIQKSNGYLDKLNEIVGNKNSTQDLYILTKGTPYIREIQINNLSIKVYKSSEFINIGRLADELYFLGSPSYFDEKFSEIFFAKKTFFVSYSCFENNLIKRNSFQDLIDSTAINTIFDHINIQKGTSGTNYKKSFDEPLKKFDPQQIIDAVTKNQTDDTNSIMVKVATLSNNHFIFLPLNQKLNTLDEDLLEIKSINTNDLEKGDWLVFRSQNGTQLIKEVADKILGASSKIHRDNINKWKMRLKKNIESKGLNKVCRILSNKYKIDTAREINLKYWVSPYCIKPRALKEILKALKFPESEIVKILESAAKIGSAHIEAGHKISQAIMLEIDETVVNAMEEKGFHKFHSKIFEGASFNIEEINSISNKTFNVSENEIMKIQKRLEVMYG